MHVSRLEIHLPHRRDKLEQAVWYDKAHRTDIWHVVRPGAQPSQNAAATPVEFNLEKIDHWISRFAEDEGSWCRYVETRGIEPFQVVFEDFLGAYESTVLAILRYLNIPIPTELRIVPPRLNKLADKVSDGRSPFRARNKRAAGDGPVGRCRGGWLRVNSFRA